MKKRIITTSLVILLLGSAAAVARPLLADDPAPTTVQINFTPDASCTTAVGPAYYCKYNSTSGSANAFNTVAVDPSSTTPPYTTVSSAWITANTVVAGLNFAAPSTNPNMSPPAWQPITLTVTLSGGSTPAPTPTPTPTPGGGSNYAFTVALPSANTFTSNRDSRIQAIFTLTTTNPTSTLTLTDPNFQTGKPEYICQQYYPEKTIMLSSSACGTYYQSGTPSTLSVSMLQYSMHPTSSPVTINYYNSTPIQLTASDTATPVSVAPIPDSQMGTTIVNFPGTTSGAPAVFLLEALNTGTSVDPVLSLAIQPGQPLTFKLPYPTNATQYKILSANAVGPDMLGASPTNIITQATSSITLQKTTMPNLRVKNWPSYMAMGTLTDLSPHSIDLLEGTTDTPARMTDAIFKYAGNDGAGDSGFVYDPDTFTDKTIALAKDIQAKTGHDVNPVLVVYTINFSGGNEASAHSSLDLTLNNTLDPVSTSITPTHQNTPPWNFDIANDSRNPAYNAPCALTVSTPAPTSDNPKHRNFTSNVQDLLCMHYYNLISIAYQLQQQPLTSVKDGSKFWGTIILNPDFIGSLHQIDIHATAPVVPMMNANNIPVANSLALAVNDFEIQHNLTGNAAPKPGSFDNTGNMAEYIKSINWIVKSFAPNVTFGWQDNVWAGEDHNWLHAAVSDPAQVVAHVNSETQFLQALDVYTDANGKRADYAPDFIAFDKYEHDDETNGVLSYAPYYYEAPVWDVYLSYAGGVSRALGNVPVMLWQIPGGHLRTQGDPDTRKQASTSADYFVGDPKLQPGLTNLADDLKQLLGTMNSVTFFGPGNTSLTLFQSSSICAPTQLFASAIVDCQNGVLSWQQGHLYNALHDNVFAVLWGGGQTTGIVGNNDVGDGLNLDDNGWLSGRLKDYYANPIQLPNGS